MDSNKNFFIELWAEEANITLNAVKALPSDMSKLDYKPDPKSRSAIQIIQHILPHTENLCKAIQTSTIEELDKNFTSVEEAADYLKTQTEKFVQALKTVDEDTWNNKNIDLVIHGRKIFSGTMRFMFWRFLFDIIHHRGQLSTYYRQMGVRNPSIYGPVAEDREKAIN